MDAIEVVEAQHLRVGALLARCLQLQPVDEHTRGPDMRERQAILRTLRRHLAQTEAAKERYLYPVVRDVLPDGRDVERRLLRSKVAAEERLLKLRWYGDRDPRLTEGTEALVAQVREHLDDEAHVLARLREAAPPELLAETGRRLERMTPRAPTRPHPDMPTSPWVAALTWRLVAVLDRLRDRIDPAPTGI